MTNFDVKTVLEELKSYRIESSDLGEVFWRAVRNHFGDLGYCLPPELQYSTAGTIKGAITQISAKIDTVFGNLETAKFFNFSKWLAHYVRMGDGDAKRQEFRVFDYGLDSLITLLLYANDGKVRENRSEAMKIESDNGLNGVERKAAEFQVAGMKVKTHLNGNVWVYGLTSEGKTRVDKVFHVYEKYRSVDLKHAAGN